MTQPQTFPKNGAPNRSCFAQWLCILAPALLALIAAPTFARQADGPIYTSLFSDLALGGYDPVAYFTVNKPAKGSSKHEFDYRGATWRFSSAKNLAAFEEDPEKFTPQYGGYCAWAMASGDTAPGKPSFWTIIEGKLYLNYSGKIQKRWEEDIPGFIVKADRHWPQAAQ